MNNHLKLIWRARFSYWQEIASLSIFLIVLAFISQDLKPNIIWLLWCWALINSGSNFWRDDFQDHCCIQWILKPYAYSIICQKWAMFLLFNSIVWLLAWCFWLLSTNVSDYLWLLTSILATMPIVLGLAVFMSSLSSNFVKNTSLLNLIILPLLAPFLIYGSAVFWHLEQHQDPSHIVAGLVAISILFIIFTPRLVLRVMIISLQAES